MNPRSVLQAATIALALTLAAAGADARSGGGHGGPGGGGGHGAGASGGQWHGGGSWQGRSPGYWHGGHGGYSRGGHGGYWYGGSRWYGGWYGPGVGLYFGLPGFWGWPYYDYAWTAPYRVYGTEEPAYSVLPAPTAPAPVTYWYYCTDPAGYYPYVQSCSKAWIPVLPQSVTPGPTAPTQQ